MGLLHFEIERSFYNNNGKRRRKGKRYKFMDIEHQSGWITLFACVAIFAEGLVLVWLWVSNNLEHYWYLTVLSAVSMLFGLIFLPDKEDISGEGAAG
jgi:hypothetical protein